LTLWYEIDPNVPVRVYGDLVRIRQVVLNLLSNALKFTKNGHVCIEVHVSPHGELPRTPSSHLIEEGISDSQHHDPETAPLIQKEAESSEKYVTLVVSVSDTGIGIPKDKLNNLFQSFSQVDASTTRNFGGTGLGLAISRRLCRMMGGDMV
jgi:signal transduction histidine kinase